MDSDCVKVTKRTFLNRICEKNACTFKEASDIYDIFIDTLRDMILSGDEVVFQGFGSFCLKLHKGHKVWFARGDDSIDDYLTLKFQPSPTFNKKYLKSDNALLGKIRERESRKSTGKDN